MRLIPTWISSTVFCGFCIVKQLLIRAPETKSRSPWKTTGFFHLQARKWFSLTTEICSHNRWMMVLLFGMTFISVSLISNQSEKLPSHSSVHLHSSLFIFRVLFIFMFFYALNSFFSNGLVWELVLSLAFKKKLYASIIPPNEYSAERNLDFCKLRNLIIKKHLLGKK